MTEQQRLRTPGSTAAGQSRDDLPDPSLRSVGEVLGDITSDLSTLLRQEVALAKAEVMESVDHAKAAGGMFAGAVVVGVLWALAAAVMAAMGRTRMRRATPLAPRTIDTAQQIPDALKGHET